MNALDTPVGGDRHRLRASCEVVRDLDRVVYALLCPVGKHLRYGSCSRPVREMVAMPRCCASFFVLVIAQRGAGIISRCNAAQHGTCHSCNMSQGSLQHVAMSLSPRS